MKRRHILCALAAILAAINMANAQNLNPTISVTRAYEGKLLDVNKPQIQMGVHDSLTRFNLDFDYSVFDNPYKGSYAFKPYILDMRPEPNPYTGRKIYLRAGAGWQLRPDFDFVWEPEMHKRTRLSVYASHKSYIGSYSAIGADHDGRLVRTGARYNGYDMTTAAGLRARTDFRKATLTFNAGYSGIHTKDSLSAYGYNSVHAGARVFSRNASSEYFHYDIGFDINYGSQGMGKATGANTALDALNILDLDVNASLGKIFNNRSRLLFDFAIGMSSYSGLFSSSAGIFSLTPKYLVNGKVVKMSLGLEVAVPLYEDTPFYGHPLNSTAGQYVYPDLHFSIVAIKDYLNVYASLTGGLDRNVYSSLKDWNHFYNPYFTRGIGPVLNNTVERFNLAAGLEGNIVSRLRYDVKLGYASYKNAVADYVCIAPVPNADYPYPWPTGICPSMTFADMNLFYVDARLQWESKDLKVDSKIGFNISDLSTRESFCFEPSLFKGDFLIEYNYKKRIFAGVDAEISSSRKGYILGSAEAPVAALIPAWADLGLYVEYALSPKFSIWIRGENLLNMNIQRTPLYSTGGIGGTAGITLNL